MRRWSGEQYSPAPPLAQSDCAAIIARIAGRSTAEEEVRLIAATINGQLLTLHFARDHLKHLMGYEDITPARLRELKRIVREQTTLLLKACMRKAV